MCTGYRGLLFKGLNEALTESFVDIPFTYQTQRKVLDLIYDRRPDLYLPLVGTYKNDPAARTTLMRMLVETFGLTGLSTLARMSPQYRFDNKADSSSIVQDRVCLPPLDVQNRLHSLTKAA